VALLVALLAGLLGMHALSPLPAGGGPTPTAVWHVEQHAQHSGHGDPDGQPLPGGHRQHSGPVCQAGAVGTSGVAGTAVLAVAVVQTPAGQPAALPLTAAAEAAGGSGCGPPSLMALSVSRT